MNTLEQTWLEPLRKLLADVRDPQPGKEGLAKMMTALSEVETLLVHNRAEMPPELVHFLERRSYEKAARFCANELGITRGACGVRA
jgi:hypothetical protein